MSIAAERQRTTRQHWAAPGGRHDRFVGLLKNVLPVIVGLLAALLLTAPFTQEQEVSFLLDKNKVEVARERMRVTEALYRGQDSKGQPFSLRAGSAVQRSSRESVVELNDLEARMRIDGDASLVAAQRGRYDIDKEEVDVMGPIIFQSANGYRLTTRDVAIDLKDRTLESAERVDGRMPIGTFSANRLLADLNQQHVTLEGNARLHIDQNGLRAR